MKIRHIRSLVDGGPVNRITACAFSPDGTRLAAVGEKNCEVRPAPRPHRPQICIYDMQGELRDRFKTKANPDAVSAWATRQSCSQKHSSFIVTSLVWSPDSTKLVVTQSDNIVFVYRLGLEIGEKKTICNKFKQTSPVLTALWMSGRPLEVLVGLAEGKVRVCRVAQHGTNTLYNAGCATLCLSGGPDGESWISGHSDGSILLCSLIDSGAVTPRRIAMHPSPPSTIAWARSIVVVGPDRQFVSYNDDGSLEQRIDLSHEKEVTIASSLPGGTSLVLGSHNQIRLFVYHDGWEEATTKHIENLYSTTALCWRSDGARLVVGGYSGALDVYDVCMRKVKVNGGKSELVHVNPSQVIVKMLVSKTQIAIQSEHNLEIKSVAFHNDIYCVAHTTDTLIIVNTTTQKLSEIPWIGSGNETFLFPNQDVCLIFNVGEMTLVAFGTNDVITTIRTEHANPSLVSYSEYKSIRRLAYLEDEHRIRVDDLVTGTSLTVPHDMRLDWISLNPRGDRLLFKDKRHRLHLVQLRDESGESITLLPNCSFVEWVPDSDVVVAQNRGMVCVWYNVDAPSQMNSFAVRGEVEAIERNDHVTEVIVDEGANTAAYALDESLIEFGAAVEYGDLGRAVDMLESLVQSAETVAMWQQLSTLAMGQRNYVIAQRCYAALGDVSKARYLGHVNKIVTATASEFNGGVDHPIVKAHIAALNRQWAQAEAIYKDHQLIDEAMEMYYDMSMWEPYVALAEHKGPAEAAKCKQVYLAWLEQNDQKSAVAALMVKEGRYMEAVHKYLEGGLPARASAVIIDYKHSISPSSQVLSSVASALITAGLFSKAGEFFLMLRKHDSALDAFRRGHNYDEAIKLAREHFASQVVMLEEEYGDWLVSQKQYDAAINHFVESGRYIKAIKTAIKARSFFKAVQILDALPSDAAAKHADMFYQIAQHYERIEDYQSASKCYIRSGKAAQAVEMFTRIGSWDQAQEIARDNLRESDLTSLMVNQAHKFELEGRWIDAERLFLEAKSPDMAISMYQQARQFENMIRLVSQYAPQHLDDTHRHLAQQLRNEQAFKEAEKHYIAAKDWQSVVQMYQEADSLEEALRAARQYGGPQAAQNLAFVLSSSGEEGIRIINRMGMMDQAIDACMDRDAWEQVFVLAKHAPKSKQSEIRLRHAQSLEEKGAYAEAEREFINAEQPREAVEMYLDQREWTHARRVADAYDPSALTDVLVAEASSYLQQKQFARAETLFLKAGKPDLLLQAYKQKGMWEDVLRVCRERLPHLLKDVQSEYERYLDVKAGKVDLMEPVRVWVGQGEYRRAVDAALKVSRDHTTDADALEEVWENAVRLAMGHLSSDEAVRVVGVVSERLVEIGRSEAAAELYLGIQMVSEAVDLCMRANLWQRAKELARSYKVSDHGGLRSLEQDKSLSDRVNRAYHEHLVAAGSAEELVRDGNAVAGLQLYARRGEWDRVLELAAKQGPDVVAHYGILYSAHLAEDGQWARALSVLMKHGGGPPNPDQLVVYKRISRQVLGSGQPGPIADLRTVLFRVVEEMKGTSDELLDRMLLIAHLLWIAHLNNERGNTEASAKCYISLLRYTNDIPVDKAFYDAGSTSRAAGWDRLAFVYFNRFLDISDAITDPDGAILENTDFEKTDIPFDVPLPTESNISQAVKDEVQDWVLAKAVDRTDQTLKRRPCGVCGTSVYEASLWCYNCHDRLPACVVTGYPVLRKNIIKCTLCDQPANREDWNRWLVKERTCPWCQQPQQASF